MVTAMFSLLCGAPAGGVDLLGLLQSVSEWNMKIYDSFNRVSVSAAFSCLQYEVEWQNYDHSLFWKRLFFEVLDFDIWLTTPSEPVKLDVRFLLWWHRVGVISHHDEGSRF